MIHSMPFDLIYFTGCFADYTTLITVILTKKLLYTRNITMTTPAMNLTTQAGFPSFHPYGEYHCESM